MTTRLGYAAHRDAVLGGRMMRVINYHNTPVSGRLALRRELAEYARHFRSVTLDDLDAFYESGTWDGDRPGFIPVFYEGYRNSYDVAAPICDELGITGFFPICTAFVDCPVPEQELFARSHYIGLVEEELSGERIALSWEEIAEMSRRHVVFPHTGSHEGIADVVTPEDFEREITLPKQRMDAVTGQSAAAFVWLHGSPWGASERHDAAVRDSGYRYLISNTMIHRIAA